MRTLIARRAYQGAERRLDHQLRRLGIGEGVAKIVADMGEVDRYYQTIEHGTYGGSLMVGLLFGFARNPSAMIDAPAQFDFYGGGGLYIAFLGFGELDGVGNVNASWLAVASGWSRRLRRHRAERQESCLLRHVRHQGIEIQIDKHGLTVIRPGQGRKLVKSVEQITYSGPEALKLGHEAVHHRTRGIPAHGGGAEHRVKSPRASNVRDVLDAMDFAPRTSAGPHADGNGIAFQRVSEVELRLIAIVKLAPSRRLRSR